MVDEVYGDGGSDDVPVIDYSTNPLPSRDTWINTVSCGDDVTLMQSFLHQGYDLFEKIFGPKGLILTTDYKVHDILPHSHPT